jgi:hypothetical protein
MKFLFVDVRATFFGPYSPSEGRLLFTEEYIYNDYLSGCADMKVKYNVIN